MIRAVALPAEHGGWGFVLEPLVLALAVAPSPGGIGYGAAVLALFLSRQPLRLVLAGAGSFSRGTRRRLALVFSSAYAAAAAVGVACGVALAGPGPLWVLAAGGPAAGLFVVLDVRKRSRQLAAQLAGAVGLATAAPAVARAAGWGWSESWVLWVLMTLRAVPSILYVRSKFRLQEEAGRDRAGVLALHVASIGVALWLWREDLVPLLSAAALIVLAARAGWGLRDGAAPARAVRVGILEVAYGLVFVLSTIAGYRWGV